MIKPDSAWQFHEKVVHWAYSVKSLSRKSLEYYETGLIYFFTTDTSWISTGLLWDYDTGRSVTNTKSPVYLFDRSFRLFSIVCKVSKTFSSKICWERSLRFGRSFSYPYVSLLRDLLFYLFIWLSHIHRTDWFFLIVVWFLSWKIFPFVFFGWGLLYWVSSFWVWLSSILFNKLCNR